MLRDLAEKAADYTPARSTGGLQSDPDDTHVLCSRPYLQGGFHRPMQPWLRWSLAVLFLAALLVIQFIPAEASLVTVS